MKTAGWDGKGDVRLLLLSNEFEKVFAADQSRFKSWLFTGARTNRWNR